MPDGMSIFFIERTADNSAFRFAEILFLWYITGLYV